MAIRETEAYRGEFLVITCPYCTEDTYINIEDDIGEGYIPDYGRLMVCKNCKKEMRVIPSI